MLVHFIGKYRALRLHPRTRGRSVTGSVEKVLGFHTSRDNDQIELKRFFIMPACNRASLSLHYGNRGSLSLVLFPLDDSTIYYYSRFLIRIHRPKRLFFMPAHGQRPLCALLNHLQITTN